MERLAGPGIDPSRVAPPSPPSHSPLGGKQPWSLPRDQGFYLLRQDRDLGIVLLKRRATTHRSKAGAFRDSALEPYVF